MVDALIDSAVLGSATVIDALRAVPRHLFVPEVPLETAYADVAIPMKLHDGRAISSASQPAIVAIMLEQLDVQLGDHVLEVGAGTGYNAALLAHLVGSAGRVRTIDIDDDIVLGAQAHLHSAGASDVEVILGDGMFGDPDGASYDRIIATVGIWDIPPSWWEQLVVGGRVVAPLSLRGPQVSIAFDKTSNDVMESSSVRPCGFMRLRGPFSQPATTAVTRGIAVTIDDEVDGPAIREMLSAEPVVRDVGLEASADEMYGSLALWLALHLDGYCTVSVGWRDAEPPIHLAVVTPAGNYGAVSKPSATGWSPALFEGTSLSVVGRVKENLVVSIFGTPAPTSQIADALRRWHEAGRPSPADVRLRAERRPTAGGSQAEIVLSREWTTFSGHWAAAR